MKGRIVKRTAAQHKGTMTLAERNRMCANAIEFLMAAEQCGNLRSQRRYLWQARSKIALTLRAIKAQSKTVR